MKTKFWFEAMLVFVLWVGVSAEQNHQQQAKQILQAANVKGGLIVHIGCGDGKLTAALRVSDSYLVHGLDSDADKVRQARQYIQSLGIYGDVAVEHFDGKSLPYAENLVNLVVTEDLGGVTMAEAMRVLAPGGILYVKQDGQWNKTIKPLLKNTDEWTHFLHDASGNAVAHDELVGPPRYVQWIAQPQHTRSHEHTPSINALVSAGGRIFYIADQAPVSSMREPAQWHLVARDAYNGIQLWKRSFNPWFPYLINWGNTPYELQRRLVAIGDRIYVTLGFHAPLSAVDAATGEILKTYEQTQGTEEMIYHKGILLLSVRSVTDERVAELEKIEQLATLKESPLHARETAQPLVDQFRSTENKTERVVLALDAETGRLLWKKTGTDTAGLKTVSLCATGDRVFYQKGKDVVCLALRTGQKLWSVSAEPLRVVCDSSVVCADGQTVTALSAETGKTLWTQPCELSEIRDAFVVKESLWLGGFKPIEGKRGPAWGPYFATQRDLATGKVLMHIEPENPGHHHRCWRNKATENYILGGRRGVEFIDLQTGDVLWHSWVRGVCKYGVMPCNGLLYAPPHACGCYIAAKLTGFYALVSENQKTEDRSQKSEEEQLQRGPAYDEIRATSHEPRATNEWPTYRHDAQRSGCTPCPVPAVLHRRWQANVGENPRESGGDVIPAKAGITSPTIADGKVFVASVDEHKVCAIDADSGRSMWNFTAGARVDSPPTLYGERVIFGSRDGYMYSLRASDGALAWRLQAARSQRLIIASGQVESVTPLYGSVLIENGVAYFTAGRSSYLDGGIDLYRVQAETGKILSRTPIYSPDPQTGKQPQQYGPAFMPGALGDILACDDRYIYLRDTVFGKDGTEKPEGNPHLLTLTGFLDDSWPHRSYWIFGTQCSPPTGCSSRDKNLIFGRLLVFNKPMIYGYGRATVHWSNHLQDGAYRLFALDYDQGKELWTKRLTIHVRAMVLTDKVLFIAGPPTDAATDQGGALLMAISASDGTELSKYRLDSAPVFDGMAAAPASSCEDKSGGRLYLSLENGQVLCMAGQ